MYIYVYQNYFAEQQKLTQHCKLTAFQQIFLKREKNMYLPDTVDTLKDGSYHL